MKILVYTCKGITTYHLLKEDKIIKYLFNLLAKDCAYFGNDMQCMTGILVENAISFSIETPYNTGE